MSTAIDETKHRPVYRRIEIGSGPVKIDRGPNYTSAELIEGERVWRCVRRTMGDEVD